MSLKKYAILDRFAYIVKSKLDVCKLSTISRFWSFIKLKIIKHNQYSYLGVF